jgi:hypothetical protein
VAPEPFGAGVRDLEEYSGRVSEESAARTYCFSGRTWTLLALPVPVGERKVKGSGMAGVPSQREGMGQEERKTREGRGSLAMGGNGPGRKGRKRESRGSKCVTHCSFLIKERTLSINAVSVTKTETLLPLDPIVFTPTTFRHTKRLPIRISRHSHKKFHFKNKQKCQQNE